jgi:predicted  nucleic acid-binding Zn-ribbon protein
MKVQQNEAESLVEKQKAEIDAQSAELVKLRASREKYVNWYWTHKEQIDELKKRIEEDSKAKLVKPMASQEPEEIDMKVQRNEMESLMERQKVEIEAQSAKLVKLTASREKYVKWYWTHKEQIEELNKKIEEDSKSFQETSKEWDKRFRAAKDETTQTKELLAASSTELGKLRASREKHVKCYWVHKDRIEELKKKIEEDSKCFRETSRKQEQRIRAAEDELMQTKELLAARSTELSGAQPFLSMTDHQTGAEVLTLVRDLNENIFQVAANLTEAWEKHGTSSRYRADVPQADLETLSQSYGPAIVQKVHRRCPAAVTFLVQSRLCDVVMQLTSSWQHNKELYVLRSVYQQKSTVGEYISHVANKMRLTHTRGTTNISWIEFLDPQLPP